MTYPQCIYAVRHHRVDSRLPTEIESMWYSKKEAMAHLRILTKAVEDTIEDEYYTLQKLCMSDHSSVMTTKQIKSRPM